MQKNDLLQMSALIVAGLAMTGCASAPTPVIPNGSHRTPINIPAKIEDYKARAAQEAANYNERTALTRQVDALNRQVAELRAYLAMLQSDAKSNHSKALPASSATTPSHRSSRANESIEMRDQKIILNITYPQGEANFNPSPKLQTQLLQAARNGKHIEIRGRTDGHPDYLTDRDITLRRALKAREFMRNNGFNPNQMGWSYSETTETQGRIE